MIRTCNCCGKTREQIAKGVWEEGMQISKRWGYFSKKDGIMHSFWICEECYDKWTGQFQIPVIEKE